MNPDSAVAEEVCDEEEKEDASRPENPPEMVDKLVNENIALAHFFANRMSFASGRDPDDILSMALQGLMRAAQLFDPTRGAKFGTYAAYHIKSAIDIRRDKLARRSLKTGKGCSVVSLDDTVSFDSEVTIGERIADERDEGAFAALLGSDDATQIHDWIQQLDERERFVIYERYGLDGGEPRTLEQVGAALKLTRERVRQIEAAVLKKLAGFAKKRHAIDETPEHGLPTAAEIAAVTIKKNRRVYKRVPYAVKHAWYLKYYAKHKARLAVKRRATYQRDRAAIIARVKAWRLANPERAQKRRKRYYEMNRAEAIAYSVKYYYEHHAELLVKAAAWREKNRENHRAYCRDKSIRLTDTYVREQLSKYHPTKSCWEWTVEEVESKRQTMLRNRAEKITDEQVAEIRRRKTAGETVSAIARDFLPRQRSMIYCIASGKYRLAAVSV